MTHDDERIKYLTGDRGDALASHERQELGELRSLLADPATWAEPGPGLEDTIVEAISAEAISAEAIGAEASPAPASSRGQVPRRHRTSRRRFVLLRPLYAFGAVAAAAVTALVIAVGTGGGGSPTLRFAMVLKGTYLAPAAHGTAVLTKTTSGWRIELNATGLPRLDNGRYYQAWLRNAAGILVPVGTFNDANSITLWSGVPATTYRVLTVTQQQASDNTASSGKRVLIGTIQIRH